MSDNRTSELLASQSFRPRRTNVSEFTQVLRFFNIILALTVIGFGVYWYVGMNTIPDSKMLDDPSMAILPAYVALSGFIILCMEFNIKFVVRNMRFLFHYMGRGIFNIYVGVLCFALIRPLQSTMYKVSVYIMGGLLVLLGVFYILATILCCARASSDYNEQKEELHRDQDIIITTSRKSINDQT